MAALRERIAAGPGFAYGARVFPRRFRPSLLLGAVAVVVVAAGCPRRAPDAAAPRDPNVRLHVEHAPGVPVVDVRDQPDGGTVRLQIGAAAVQLPSREPEPPPTTPE